MAHFAKLGVGNKVLTVVVVHNDVATTEQAGVDFLNKTYGTNDIWKEKIMLELVLNIMKV